LHEQERELRLELQQIMKSKEQIWQPLLYTLSTFRPTEHAEPNWGVAHLPQCVLLSRNGRENNTYTVSVLQLTRKPSNYGARVAGIHSLDSAEAHTSLRASRQTI